MPDSEVAALLNRSRSAVQTRRVLLRKPKPDPKHSPWTPQEEALLGTAPDAQIAARIERQTATLATRRYKLHLPPAPVVRADTWSAAEHALLGTAQDETVSRHLTPALR